MLGFGVFVAIKAAVVNMKFLVILLFLCGLLFPVFPQTNTKKKQVDSNAAQKKPTPKPTASANKTKGTKSASTAAAKTKAAVKKRGGTANSTSAGKPPVKKSGVSDPGTSSQNNQKISKPNPTKANSAKAGGAAAATSKRTQSTKKSTQIASNAALVPKKNTQGKTSSSKAKQVDAAEELPDGKAEYDAANAITDQTERLTALRKFIDRYPASPLQSVARTTITTADVEMGNAALKDRDLTAAATAFVQAAKDAPVPIADELFNAGLSRLPVGLYFSGQKDAAFVVAKILEGKCGTNPAQLLSLAEFYVSIESGSDAKRLANAAIELAPDKSSGYQMLGLANRIEFQLDDAAAAYGKAVELEPDSAKALIGLAEMKRALEKPGEAIDLYKRVLAKTAENSPAKTGLALALFEDGKREEAETQMEAALSENPGNLMLLAGAAYWYAAHNEGQKAVETAQRAITADPRFIWSHIALARGYMALQRPLDAERTLLIARRYGNFPTMDYEIASARLMAGLYREAAEQLAKSFAIKDGVVSTKLGGRVARGAEDLTDLVSLERRASIAEPRSADNADAAARLRALLAFWNKLNSESGDPGALGKAADEFVRGDDVMKAHRLLFAANQLLERKKELPKVVELAKAATGYVEAAVDIPSPAAAVMADELYESRRLAALKDEYVTIPDVARSTLLSIMRGRIEDIAGWALFEADNSAESIVKLRRAVSVLPQDSAWWRSSTWRLGTALESSGQDRDALESYVKSYRSGPPDAIKYSIIAAVYKRVTGSTFGLEAKVGVDPSIPAAESTAGKTDQQVIPSVLVSATPERTPEPATKTVEASAAGSDGAVGNPSPSPTPASLPAPEPSTSPVEPTPSPTPARAESTPEATPAATKDEEKPVSTPTPDNAPTKAEPTPEPKAESTPVPSPTPEGPVTGAEPTREASSPKLVVKTDPSPEPTATRGNVASEPVTDKGSPSQSETAKPEKDPDAAKRDQTDESKGSPPTKTIDNQSLVSSQASKDLFPPVVITVPEPNTAGKSAKAGEKRSDTEAETKEPVQTVLPAANDKMSGMAANDPDTSKTIRPRVVPGVASEPSCTLVLSDDSISLENNGGRLAVIVRTEDERDISALTATSSSPADVYARIEPIEGITGRALYVIRSLSKKQGIFQVTFALPCGSKDLVVKVR